MNRLFVYGIFLDEMNRLAFGMSNPNYATVKGFVTIGGQIVAAYRAADYRLALTGLVVDVEPSRWVDIDSLEYGYRREVVTTTDGEEVFMYISNQSD